MTAAFTSADIKRDRIDTQYIDSVQKNFALTQQHYAIEAIRNLESMPASNIGNVEKAAENLTVNGTYRGELQRSNIGNWTEKAQELSSRLENIKVSDFDLDLDNLTLKTGSRLIAELRYGNVSEKVRKRSTITGVRDPIASKLYPVNFSACRYDKPVEKIASGTISNGTARGTPIKTSDPGSVNNKNEKIIYDQDITKYAPGNITGFAGYISKVEPGSPGSFNDNYVAGLSQLPEFEEGQNALIQNGVWISNVNYSISEQCYFTTAHQDTPSVKDRIKSVTGTRGEGVYTFVDTSKTGENASKSNIAYQRVRGNSNLRKIEGISTGDGQIWSYFRVGESLARKTGFEELMN